MRVPHRLPGISALALVLVLLAWVSTAAATGPSRTVAVGPGESIQAAVDAARPGTTIVVRGEHRENVVITKDRITLRGRGAVLLPPATPTPNACYDPAQDEAVNGICILGRVDRETGAVRRAVKHVTVSRFTVRDFTGSGIVAVGAWRPVFKGNVTAHNHEYGLATFSSVRSQILVNRAYGSEEAGIYVGDAPRAKANVIGNDAHHNLFGVFVRNARMLNISGNVLHGNCAGLLVLADAPGPAGDARVRFNAIHDNTRACPAGEEAPPLSGVGVLLLGADDVDVFRNIVNGNVPTGPSAYRGGVAIVTGIGGTPPRGNRVTRNVFLENAPDLFWDGAGEGNVVRRNLCSTAEPAALCPEEPGEPGGLAGYLGR